jgi:hypothetical protein
MLLQVAPATFNDVELAVVRWIVNQFNDNIISVSKFNQSLHELSTRAGNLWTIVQLTTSPPLMPLISILWVRWYLNRSASKFAISIHLPGRFRKSFLRTPAVILCDHTIRIAVNVAYHKAH